VGSTPFIVLIDIPVLTTTTDLHAIAVVGKSCNNATVSWSACTCTGVHVCLTKGSLLSTLASKYGGTRF